MRKEKETPFDRSGFVLAPVEGKGKGLVATRVFASGDIIELAPVLIVPAPNYRVLKASPSLAPIRARTFTWIADNLDEKNNVGAIAYGLVTFCNHHADANAKAHKNYENETIELVAAKEIGVGDEILISYHTPEIVEIRDWVLEV